MVFCLLCRSINSPSLPLHVPLCSLPSPPILSRLPSCSTAEGVTLHDNHSRLALCRPRPSQTTLFVSPSAA
eukprot:6208558-Pleurochrysis_carterae.AAC.1